MKTKICSLCGKKLTKKEEKYCSTCFAFLKNKYKKDIKQRLKFNE